jgi:uncharacterized membrane protein YqjE
MEPIATYSESRFSGKRDFELYTDKLQIKGKVFLKSDFETLIELNNIKPHFEKIRVREPAFMGGVGMVLAALLIMFILHSVFDVLITNKVMGFMIILVVSGFLLCAATFRKVEFYRFKNLSDTVVLDIARSGKDKNRFDSFVEKIISCINGSKCG